MAKTKFAITLTVEAEWPAALDVLTVALGNPAEMVRTLRRFDLCLERAVNTTEALSAWRYVVKEIRIAQGDQTQ